MEDSSNIMTRNNSLLANVTAFSVESRSNNFLYLLQIIDFDFQLPSGSRLFANGEEIELEF